MTLNRTDQARAARLAARERVLFAGETVGHGRRMGTLTAQQLDELRDAVVDYDKATRAFLLT